MRFMLPAKASHLWSPPTRVTDREEILALALLPRNFKAVFPSFAVPNFVVGVKWLRLCAAVAAERPSSL